VAAAVFLAEAFADYVFALLKISSYSSTRFGASCPSKWTLLPHLIELLAAIPSVVYGLWGLSSSFRWCVSGNATAARQMGWVLFSART